jgi:hypothetical protein
MIGIEMKPNILFTIKRENTYLGTTEQPKSTPTNEI